MGVFVRDLDTALRDRIRALAEQISGTGTAAKVPPMPALLKAALRNEWETALLTSFWVTDEADAELRIDLARLAGDEARHFSLIQVRLAELGESISVAELDERTPLFEFLRKQTRSLDRAVTGPFAREALAVARNEVFLEHCREVGDERTIAMYETIQEDEAHHHELGRRYLEEHLTSATQLAAAKEKMLEMLALVGDIQEMIVMQRGVCRIPGC